jgi:hypothetical protein
LVDSESLSCEGCPAVAAGGRIHPDRREGGRLGKPTCGLPSSSRGLPKFRLLSCELRVSLPDAPSPVAAAAACTASSSTTRNREWTGQEQPQAEDREFRWQRSSGWRRAAVNSLVSSSSEGYSPARKQSPFHRPVARN